MKEKTHFRIGLTGGIASGKTTVGMMLRQLGASVVDTDAIAREVTQPGSAELAEMARHFGPGILHPDGSLRRDVMGSIVFSNPAEKKWLESLLHPQIRAQAEKQARAAIDAGQRIIVFDVPLLFESGWNEWVDAVWTVYVPPEIQKVRLRQRDGLSEKDIRDRLDSQWPISEKADRADVVIDNTGSPECTRQQVERAWSKVLNMLTGMDYREDHR